MQPAPDCGPGTWANGCRQVTVFSALNFGTLTSEMRPFVPEAMIHRHNILYQSFQGSGTDYHVLPGWNTYHQLVLQGSL
jgi:hypothetical protein